MCKIWYIFIFYYILFIFINLGSTFDVSLEGNNVKLDCSYTSINSGSIIPVCCAAINLTSSGIYMINFQ